MRGLKSVPSAAYGGAPSLGDGDDVDDADFERFLGYNPRAIVTAPPSGGRQREESHQPAEIALDMPLGVRPAARPPAPDYKALLSDYKGPPIHLGAERLPHIPYDVYAAALTLLDGDRQGDIKLGRQFVAELRQLTTSYKHEYCMVDPPVLLSDSVALGPQGPILYIEEVVPISYLLLALFLDCRPSIPGKALRAYSEMRVRPYEGIETQGCHRFGLKEQIPGELEQRGYNADEVLRNLQIHMLRAGEMSSHEAADGTWIADCLEQMGAVVQGQPVHHPSE